MNAESCIEQTRTAIDLFIGKLREEARARRGDAHTGFLYAMFDIKDKRLLDKSAMLERLAEELAVEIERVCPLDWEHRLTADELFRKASDIREEIRIKTMELNSLYR